ncbi:hypothetical protein EXT42_08880 [Pseudoalteromonas sp. CO302Y]|uniref:DUF4124 domain-containing protein n=1 Tax=unclassified Pseudoalteromonas TaxID=194690 RepID=UPI00102318CB|nr:hypothetical protein EXT42_08880 [Pseudoalteromonas sp. CO302Y]RZG09971.1 hypothetical protein EXT40_08890 [Pseudoalteromonas sp. CO133X]
MQIQFKTVIFLSCAYLMFTNVVNATVYQCEKNGVVEFSQQPCGKDARLVIIKEQNPHVSDIFESAPVKPDSGVDSYIRVKQIDAEIQQHHNKIDTLTQRLDNDIASLSKQADAQLNNVVGNKKVAAIAKQMTATSQRYKLLIDNEQRGIDRLNTEKATLLAQSDQTVDAEVDSFIRTQQIKREITEHQNKIDTLYAQLNSQLSQLEQQTRPRAVNLTGVSADEALSEKMTAVTSKFDTLIAVEQRQIDRLNTELGQL